MQVFCTSALHRTVVPCDSMAFLSFISWQSCQSYLKHDGNSFQCAYSKLKSKFVAKLVNFFHSLFELHGKVGWLEFNGAFNTK